MIDSLAVASSSLNSLDLTSEKLAVPRKNRFKHKTLVSPEPENKIIRYKRENPSHRLKAGKNDLAGDGHDRFELGAYKNVRLWNTPEEPRTNSSLQPPGPVSASRRASRRASGQNVDFAALSRELRTRTSTCSHFSAMRRCACALRLDSPLKQNLAARSACSPQYAHQHPTPLYRRA